MAIAKRKKKFFDVDMPILKRQTQLQAFEIAELDGKFLKYDLTRILKGKSSILQLVVSVKDDKATSIPRELILMPTYLKRMTRKGTDYVEDSFDADCKNCKIKIKPLIVTRRRVSKAVKKGLREKAKEELQKYVKTKNDEQLFEDILKNKLQKELSLILKKIYPLSVCEIKSIKVLEKIKDEKTKK